MQQLKREDERSNKTLVDIPETSKHRILNSAEKRQSVHVCVCACGEICSIIHG